MKICKFCGKEIISRCSIYFCSKKCQMAYQTLQLKNKYDENPHYCKKCHSMIPFEKRNNIFCNNQCSASYNTIGKIRSEESKRNISNGIKNSINYDSMIQSIKDRMPQKIIWRCPVCKKDFLLYPYDAKHKKYCSKICYDIDHGGKQLYCSVYRPGPENKGGRNSFKGYYKNIWCDSTFELVWVIYNLDHNIQFERNQIPFPYVTPDNKTHNYYPDFKQNNDYIEIKNYLKGNDQFKIQQFPYKLTILFEKDLKLHFDYVYSKYGKDLKSLYDKKVMETEEFESPTFCM